MEELRDENVHFEDICDILSFDVSQDVYEPLKMPMRRTDPQEINLENKTIVIINLYLSKELLFLHTYLYCKTRW